jgi:predicted nuclease of restriction endonuclease-like (RecB) superfamily
VWGSLPINYLQTDISMNNFEIDISYNRWLQDFKKRISEMQVRAALSINQVLLELYWELGKNIIEKQNNAIWGNNIIEKLSIDLKHEFPEIKGFSRRNLYAIRQWYLFYSDKFEFVPQAVAQIPWGHNRLIISKIKDIEIAIRYCQATISNGWGRDILEAQIENNYIERKGKAITNFDQTLPLLHSELVHQTIKDPYHFDFLGLEEDAQERDIERQLVHKITDFLLELGKGFAFVGQQYKIEVGETDYFIDLLFYHLDLRCYIVIELKAVKFQPEFAGKLNFYLSAVDSLLKKKEDNQTLGIILCKSKDKIEAEFALRDINKPIGIANYNLTKAIPENLKSKLPTVEELEKDLSEKLNKNKTI